MLNHFTYNVANVVNQIVVSGKLFVISGHCHSPTQPQLELELDLIIGRKPPPPHHTGTFKALPGNLGS
jgi:hypothetical protein